jgi:ABC-type lipoprotein release transport system permease subunit
MAYRDLGRNRRRTFFSALALGIGLALLLLMAAFIEGELRSSMDATIKLQSGHLQVRAPTYDENKSSLAWEDLVENPEDMAARIAALAPVKAATPRLFASGIVVVGDRSAGVRIIGVDPASPANAPYRDGLVSGEFLQADDREGLLIGQPLAEKMGLTVGSQVNLLVNTSDGSVDEQRFTIRGMYSTSTLGYDEVTVFMPLAKAQAITQAGDHASVIFILLNDKAQTQAVLSALQTGQYQVKTWEQLNSLLALFDQYANSYIILLYLIVLAITATVIVNTLIMSVFERTREIGILSAMGMRGGRIMAMFFAESALLGIGGIAIGLVLGGLLVAYTSKYGFNIANMGITGVLLRDRITTYLTLKDTITLAVTAFVVTLLAALYPALLAARMEPVDALRGGK